jgi:hypothetical protein
MLAFVMALVSCSSIKVVVDQDEHTDFSNYETYTFLGWQNHSDKDLSEEDKLLLRDAFTKEFERRGMKRQNSGGDMEISLYIVTSQETAVSGYNDYVARRGTYHHYGGGYGYSSNNTYSQRDKLVGTMIMNVYDGKSKAEIWQAIATGTVNKKPEKRKRSIPSTIGSLMRQFPVKSK